MESKFNFTLKDLIYIITLVLSLAGGYYTMKSRVDALEEKIKDHNLELIEFKLDLIDKQLNKILDALK